MNGNPGKENTGGEECRSCSQLCIKKSGCRKPGMNGNINNNNWLTHGILPREETDENAMQFKIYIEGSMDS